MECIKKNQKTKILPIERWICNLIDEMAATHRGSLQIEYQINNQKLKFYIPKTYRELSQVSLINLFRCLFGIFGSNDVECSRRFVKSGCMDPKHIKFVEELL